MRVSFDLDDTLVCYRPDVPRESVPWLLRCFFREPLRLGSTALMHQLARRGVKMWVYTTSHRPAWYIKIWFRLVCGVPIEGVVNQNLHEQKLRALNMWPGPTKLPSAFGIDLHVDDSQGVALEAERFGGGEILVVQPMDRGWDAKVLAAVEEILKSARLVNA